MYRNNRSMIYLLAVLLLYTIYNLRFID